MLSVIHLLLGVGIPFLCGLAAGWLASGVVRGALAHTAFCLVAIVGSIVAGYAAFLVFGGVVTGQWPAAVTLAGLVYALAWFAIVAIFTSVPMVAAGYVVGHVSRRPTVTK
jgi:hypothetical protein